MSFYKAGCSSRAVPQHQLVGATEAPAPKKKNNMLTIAIVVGLTGVIYFGIPMLKGSAQ